MTEMVAMATNSKFSKLSFRKIVAFFSPKNIVSDFHETLWDLTFPGTGPISAKNSDQANLVTMATEDKDFE